VARCAAPGGCTGVPVLFVLCWTAAELSVSRVSRCLHTASSGCMVCALYRRIRCIVRMQC
jgi:hypothetical protein